MLGMHIFGCSAYYWMLTCRTPIHICCIRVGSPESTIQLWWASETMRATPKPTLRDRSIEKKLDRVQWSWSVVTDQSTKSNRLPDDINITNMAVSYTNQRAITIRHSCRKELCLAVQIWDYLNSSNMYVRVSCGQYAHTCMQFVAEHVAAIFQ